MWLLIASYTTANHMKMLLTLSGTGIVMNMFLHVLRKCNKRSWHGHARTCSGRQQAFAGGIMEHLLLGILKMTCMVLLLLAPGLCLHVSAPGHLIRD